MAFFGYGRVSTEIQMVENQKLELARAGYNIEPEFWFVDIGVSGKISACDRPGFSELLSKIRRKETLVVAKLDRLGRDAIDVMQTVKILTDREVRVIVLQLGELDIASPAGKMMLTMLAAVAELERDNLIERTLSGLARARSAGRVGGRPRKIDAANRAIIQQRYSVGASILQMARELNVSRATIGAVIRETRPAPVAQQRN